GLAPEQASVGSRGKQMLPGVAAPLCWTRAVGWRANTLWLTVGAVAGFPGNAAASVARAEGRMAGLPAWKRKVWRWRMSWPSTKKKALFFLMGPPKVPPKTFEMNLSRLLRPGSERSALVIASSTVELRWYSKAEPWNSLPPPLVTMLTTAPWLRPNCAE